MLPPELPGLVEVLGIRRVAAVEQDVFVGVEFELVLLEQVVHVGDVLFEAFDEPLVNGESGRQVGGVMAAKRERVEIGPVMREFGEVRLQEIFMARVEGFHVIVEKFSGHLRVQRLLRVMIILQKPRRPIGDVAVVRAGLEPWPAPARWVGGGGGVFRVVTQPAAMRKQKTAASAIQPMFFNFKWRMMICTTSTNHNGNRSAAKPF